MYKVISKAISFTLVSLGLIAGSFAAPMMQTEKAQASHIAPADASLDFIKEVKKVSDCGTCYSQSVSPSASDEVTVRIYVFNTKNGVAYNGGTLRDQLPTGSGSVTGQASTTFTDPAIGRSWGTAVINVPAGKRLEYVQGSLIVVQPGLSPSSIADVNGVNQLFLPGGYSISSLMGGDPSNPSDPNKRWYLYKLRLVDATAPIIEPAPRMDFAQTVANVTTNSTFANSITITDGQTSVFKIWVHNGVTGSTARNQVLKTTLGTATGTSHASTSTLTTSNAGNHTATATLNTATALGVRYVAGSTKIIDHFGNVTNVADVGGTSPLFTTAGLNLGDQQGCFEFEKFVTFQVTTTAVAAAVTPPPTVAKPAVLPATGPESAIQLLLAGMIPAGALIRRFRI